MKKVGLGCGEELHKTMNNKLTQVFSIVLREQQKADIKKILYLFSFHNAHESFLHPPPCKNGRIPHKICENQ